MLKGYEALELSTQMIIKEARSRDIEVEVLDWDDNFIRLKKAGKIEYLKQATRTSIDSYISPLIMENKEVTKLILREKGLSVPKGLAIKSIENYKAGILEFLGKDIVIKPKSTNFGQGVVILKQPYTDNDVFNAVEHALKYDKSVLIEEFISGKEYRFLVVGEDVVAILHRIPANVTGDGKRTIKELVDGKNKDPLRGKGYVTPLEKINLGHIEKEYLAFQGKDFATIPASNEIVYLRENSNISTGGDSIDFTDDIISEYKTIAVEAAKSVGAKICGADIIIRDIKASPKKENYSIIELNYNPALHIHDFPYKGKNRQVEKKVLELLGF